MDLKDNKSESYYLENIENHISDLKTAIVKNREVIVQDVIGDLSEDKYVNVIKARRMASDDNLYYYKEIDRLEKELKGDTAVEEKKPRTVNRVKQHTS